MRAAALQRECDASPTGSTIDRMFALQCRRPVRGQLDATMVSSQLHDMPFLQIGKACILRPTFGLHVDIDNLESKVGGVNMPMAQLAVT
jgi:hypothetical protein